jgi:hypothetical protein
LPLNSNLNPSFSDQLIKDRIWERISHPVDALNLLRTILPLLLASIQRIRDHAETVKGLSFQNTCGTSHFSPGLGMATPRSLGMTYLCSSVSNIASCFGGALGRRPCLAVIIIPLAAQPKYVLYKRTFQAMGHIDEIYKIEVTTAHNAITGTATSSAIDCIGYNSILFQVTISVSHNWTFRSGVALLLVARSRTCTNKPT